MKGEDMNANEEFKKDKEFYQRQEKERKKNNLILLGSAAALGTVCALSYYSGYRRGGLLGVNLMATAIHNKFPEVAADKICETISGFHCPVNKIEIYFPKAALHF